jgi:hypothetical protein
VFVGVDCISFCLCLMIVDIGSLQQLLVLYLNSCRIQDERVVTKRELKYWSLDPLCPISMWHRSGYRAIVSGWMITYAVANTKCL